MTSPEVSPTDLSFDSWYRALHPRLVAAMALTTGHLDEAADIADEALARALERWPAVSGMASPDGWAFQVAYNLVRRRARRRKLEETLLRRFPARPADGDLPAPAGEAWAIVAGLPRRQREVVVLRFVADLPEDHIAAALGIARGTVSSTLADAKRSLALELSDPGTPDSKHGPRSLRKEHGHG